MERRRKGKEHGEMTKKINRGRGAEGGTWRKGRLRSTDRGPGG
jgi:hypothetical protein